MNTTMEDVNVAKEKIEGIKTARAMLTKLTDLFGLSENPDIANAFVKFDNSIAEAEGRIAKKEEELAADDSGMTIAELKFDGDRIEVRVPCAGCDCGCDCEETEEVTDEGNFIIKIEEYLSGDTVATYHCNGFNLTDNLSDDNPAEDGIAIFIPQSLLVKVE